MVTAKTQTWWCRWLSTWEDGHYGPDSLSWSLQAVFSTNLKSTIYIQLPLDVWGDKTISIKKIPNWHSLQVTWSVCFLTEKGWNHFQLTENYKKKLFMYLSVFCSSHERSCRLLWLRNKTVNHQYFRTPSYTLPGERGGIKVYPQCVPLSVFDLRWPSESQNQWGNCVKVQLPSP